jgi:hypothetical protein
MKIIGNSVIIPCKSISGKNIIYVGSKYNKKGLKRYVRDEKEM